MNEAQQEENVVDITKVNVKEKFLGFSRHWDPKIVGALNDQHVKLVKFKGAFVWHHHEAEDELFYVIQGRFEMHLRDRTIPVYEGEFIIVPRGVEHRPEAEEEVHIMLFEPASTVNTGNAPGSRTIQSPEWI